MTQTITDNIKLLVLEDDPTTAALYGEYLNGEGYSIKQVDRVGDALSALSDANFDAVLLDLNVIDSRGLDTLEKVSPVTDTPIIVLTGSIGEEMAQKAKLMGATDYLRKDRVRPEIVARVVGDAVLQHKRHRLKSLAERLNRIGGQFDDQ